MARWIPLPTIFCGALLLGLLACGGGGGITSPAPAPPSITSFSVSPTTVASGGSATLTAVFANGIGSVDQAVGVVQSGVGVSTGPLTTNRTYTLTVTGSGTPATAQVTVTVTALPPSITSFTVNPSTVAAGGSAILTATFANGSGSIDQGIGAVQSGVGVSTGALSASRTYTLTVTGSGTPATAQVTVAVTAPPSPSIASFTVNPTTVAAGGSATLTATFANGSGSIDQGVGAVQSGVGVSTGPLSANRTYTLTVTGSGTPATAQVTVSVAVPTAVYMGNPLPTAGQSMLLLAEKVWAPYPFAPYEGAPLPARVERIHRAGYSESFRVPLWTSYRSFKKDTYTALPDRQDFLQDPDSTAAVKYGDFTNSGYTRGHMVPRADVGYRYSADAQAGTFILTNICPQIEGHNSGIWQQLESLISGSLSGSTWTPGLADTFTQIWVLTGPVVDANPARLPSQIAIPSAFYKIVVRERSAGDPVALAILTPHEDLDTSAMPDYVTSVRRIEQVTGLNFFPDLPSATQETFENTVDVRGWGAPFERTGSPVQAAMVEPSWNLTVASGTVVNFKGAAVTATNGGSIATQSWSFGDTGTATGPSASHTYTNSTPLTVTLTASYTATDSAAATRTVSRQIKVLSSNPANTPPTISTVSNQVLAKNTALPATAFTVGDLETPAASLLVSAHSSNATLLPDSALVLGGSGAARTLAATPATDQTGSAQITLTVTDGGGLTATSVFQISVTGSGTLPGRVIISQYYEGASNDKWIEVTNVGGQGVDFASPQLYLALFSNAAADAPAGVVPNATFTLGGAVAPGASLLFKNSSAALPAYAVGTATNVCQFNEDDLVILTTTTDASAWANRIDVVGNGTSWGKDTSFHRAPGILEPNATWTPSEWIQKTMAEVNAAALGTSERLGVHLFNLPTLAGARD